MNGTNNGDMGRMDGVQNSHQIPFIFNGGTGQGQTNPANTLFSSLNGSSGLTPANLMGLAGGGNIQNGFGAGQASSLFSAFQGGNLRPAQEGSSTTGGGTSIEDQILQRASALRAEALRQQQPQNQDQALQQQRHQLEVALAALQQQQQLASLANLGLISTEQQQQQQESFFSHAAALRNLGLAALPGSSANPNDLQRLQQQLNISLAEEEMERARQRQQQMSSTLLPGPPGPGRPEADKKVSRQVKKNKKDNLPKGFGPFVSIPDKKAPIKHASSDDKKRRPSAMVSTTDNNENVSSLEDDEDREESRKRPGTVIVPCRGECYNEYLPFWKTINCFIGCFSQ
jgi:hypothetical protein